MAGHGQKGLFDIARGFRGCFEEFNSEAVGKFFALFGGDHALSRQIGLVTDQQLVDILRSVSVNFVQPLLYIVERLVVRDVVDNNNAVGSAVVRRGNRAETLLPSCIPNLKLDRLAVQVNGTDFLRV